MLIGRIGGQQHRPPGLTFKVDPATLKQRFIYMKEVTRSISHVEIKDARIGVRIDADQLNDQKADQRKLIHFEFTARNSRS